MHRLRLIALLTLALAVLAGCSGADDREPDRDDEQDRFAEAFPSEPDPLPFTEIARESIRPERERSSVPPAEAHLATSALELERGWELYRLPGEQPSIDFAQNEVLFLGVIESGSCPWLLEDVRDGASELLVLLDYDVDPPEDDQPLICTDDDNPLTFVVELDAGTVSGDNRLLRFFNLEWGSFPMRTDERGVQVQDLDEEVPG